MEFEALPLVVNCTILAREQRVVLELRKDARIDVLAIGARVHTYLVVVRRLKVICYILTAESLIK